MAEKATHIPTAPTRMPMTMSAILFIVSLDNTHLNFGDIGSLIGEVYIGIDLAVHGERFQLVGKNESNHFFIGLRHRGPAAFVHRGNTLERFGAFEMKGAIVFLRGGGDRQCHLEREGFCFVACEPEIVPVDGPGDGELVLHGLAEKLLSHRQEVDEVLELRDGPEKEECDGFYFLDLHKDLFLC